jgi:cholesterol transport system auxiliary component
MRLPIAALLLLCTTHCSVFPKPQSSAVHDFGYPYSSSSSPITTLTRQPPVTVEAPKWLVDNRIHYRLLYTNPTQVRFYTLDRWIAPPAELFEQLLNASAKPWAVPTTIQLHVFEQQFISSTQANVIMHFTVTTVPDDKNQKSIERDFHLQAPCPTPDAKGAVSAFNKLTRQGADKIKTWLSEAL